MNNQEIWKPIEGYDGIYEVSSFGNVRHGERLLKTTPWGLYPTVHLSKNHKVRTLFVHRLVAKAFIPNPLNKPCINHIDCNKLNNRAENLEWCTRQENERHAWANGLKEKIRETSRINAVIARQYVHNKIPVEQLSLDGEVIKRWDSISDAERTLGISGSSISKCCKGNAYRAGKYKWRYLER